MSIQYSLYPLADSCVHVGLMEENKFSFEKYHLYFGDVGRELCLEDAQMLIKIARVLRYSSIQYKSFKNGYNFCYDHGQ